MVFVCHRKKRAPHYTSWPKSGDMGRTGFVLRRVYSRAYGFMGLRPSTTGTWGSGLALPRGWSKRYREVLVFDAHVWGVPRDMIHDFSSLFYFG